MTDFRIAVLIDADNISHQYAGPLLEELTKYGRTTVKRAYADWTGENMKGWKDKLNRHAIAPEQAFSYTKGKNSTDSALIIDAMDLLYSGNVDGFAIVSSDSDFTRLANRLRASGKIVYGVGRKTTARALQEACDQFIQLEFLDTGEVQESDEPDRVSSPPAPVNDLDDAPEQPNLHSLLTRAVNNAAGDDGWAHLGSLGTSIRRLYSAFVPREFGYSSLAPLVEDQHFLVFDQENQRVGLKGKVDVPREPAKKAVKKPAKKAVGARNSTRKTTAKKVAAQLLE